MKERTVGMPWAVRDWTTCFLQCGFPIEEEPATYCSPSSAQVPGQKLAFHSNKRLHTNDASSSGYQKQNRTAKESIRSSEKTRKTMSLQKEPSFADEDYIVFQLTKNGSIHAVNNNDDDKTEASTCDYRANKSSSRNIRTKIIFREHGERVYRSNHTYAIKGDEGDSRITDEANSAVCHNEGKVKWSKKSSKVEKNHCENIHHACETTSAEQSESMQSDGSSSSFAFPELNWEEIGSPKQMYAPDSMRQLTKHKAYTAISHSCRF